MKAEAYREHLQGQDVPDAAVERQMAVVGDFVRFLAALGLKETTATAAKEAVERFAAPRRKREVICGRALLRVILARCTGIDPQSLPLRVGEHGKPLLEGSLFSFKNCTGCQRLQANPLPYLTDSRKESIFSMIASVQSTKRG